MKNIFNQIHRFENLDVTFEEGKEFTFELPSIKHQAIRPVSNVITKTVIPQTDTMVVGGTYTIKVKQYMTERATPSFDFQAKWNDNKPMPLVVMDGKVLQETRGMFKMELHGTARPTSVCCCCGRRLTNKISMLYGIGPECGNHFYINPFDSEEELEKHWQELKQRMEDITWTGWVIKSAIKEWNVVEEN